MSKDSSLHPKFQMASNIPRETSFLVPKEPTRYLPFQMCQSPLVTPTRPLQSSHSVHERDLHQKDSQEPSRNSGMRMQTSVVMGPGLPTLRRLSGQPSHQILSRTSVSSGFPVPIGSMPLSDKYYNKQSGPVAPRKCRKERTVYSKEQKCLLQEHFHQCQNPDLNNGRHWHYWLVWQNTRSRYASLFSLCSTPKGSLPQSITWTLCFLSAKGTLEFCEWWLFSPLGVQLFPVHPILIQPGTILGQDYFPAGS